MLVNKCNCLLVGVIEVYFDVNDYKVPAINTNEMFSRVNEKRIYVIDITFGINESIFSGNEQQKV